MVAVAELEAGMISARTKAALAAAKKRGKKLGGNRGIRPNGGDARAFYGGPATACGHQGRGHRPNDQKPADGRRYKPEGHR
jgi:DNA invertase Pin-like site-specific DNA recombinase